MRARTSVLLVLLVVVAVASSTGCVSKKMFRKNVEDNDTRVAAVSLGMKAAGLAAVLDHWLGVTIDKKFQRSNWGARPLSEGQKDYARRDTHYLLDLADELRHDLAEAGFPHVEEVSAECRRLEMVAPEPRRADPAEFTRVKGAKALDRTIGWDAPFDLELESFEPPDQRQSTCRCYGCPHNQSTT